MTWYGHNEKEDTINIYIALFKVRFYCYCKVYIEYSHFLLMVQSNIISIYKLTDYIYISSKNMA